MPSSIQLCSQPMEVPSVAEKMVASLLHIMPTSWEALAAQLPCVQSFVIKSHPRLSRCLGFTGFWDRDMLMGSRKRCRVNSFPQDSFQGSGAKWACSLGAYPQSTVKHGISRGITFCRRAEDSLWIQDLPKKVEKPAVVLGQNDCFRRVILYRGY